MTTLEAIIEKAKVRLRRIVLSEGEDSRVIEAAIRAKGARLAWPILIGRKIAIETHISKNGLNSNGLEIIDPNNSENLEYYSSEYSILRKNRKISKDEARNEMKSPLNFASMMVRLGHADGTIGGAVATTSDTVAAALKVIGRADGTNTVSSFFLIIMDKPHHSKKATVIFSDCGLVIEPTVGQLAEIANQSAKSYKKLVGGTPKVAMLSFSTRGSAKHSRVNLVKEATKMAKLQAPDLNIDGELQFDAAFVSSISEIKAKDSPIMGEANVMVFPNLDAANIGYKIAERIGGARAIGPILQGLSKPANDLSRGCSVQDIYDLIAVTAVQVE